MSDLHRSHCKTACAQLCLDFVNGVDARDYERCVKVFAPDIRFDHVSGLLEGRDGVMQMLLARPADVVTRHACTNIDITDIEATRAKGKCYVMLFRGSSPSGSLPLPTSTPLFVEYHDEYGLLDGQWRITYRKTVVIFH